MICVFCQVKSNSSLRLNEADLALLVGKGGRVRKRRITSFRSQQTWPDVGGEGHLHEKCDCVEDEEKWMLAAIYDHFKL